MIEYETAPDKPSTLVQTLAKRNYRPDTIEAAVLNEYGYPISRGFINDACRNAKRGGHERSLAPMPGLMKADEAYRKQMEAANREFVARLQWAMAA